MIAGTCLVARFFAGSNLDPSGIHFRGQCYRSRCGSIEGRAIPRLKIFSGRLGFGDFSGIDGKSPVWSAVFYFLTVRWSRWHLLRRMAVHPGRRRNLNRRVILYEHPAQSPRTRLISRPVARCPTIIELTYVVGPLIFPPFFPLFPFYEGF